MPRRASSNLAPYTSAVSERRGAVPFHLDYNFGSFLLSQVVPKFFHENARIFLP